MKKDREAIQSMLSSIKNNATGGILGTSEQVDKLEKYIGEARMEYINGITDPWKGLLGDTE